MTIGKLHSECVVADEPHALKEEVEAVKVCGARAAADVGTRGRDIVEDDGLVARWGGADRAEGGAFDHCVPHRMPKAVHIVAGARDIIVVAHKVARDTRGPVESDLLEANIVHKVHVKGQLHARLLERNHARNHPTADTIPLKDDACEGAVLEVDICWGSGVVLIVISPANDVVVEVVE